VGVQGDGSRGVVEATGDVALMREDDQVVADASVDVLGHPPDGQGGCTGVGVLDAEDNV
jgi:hypothetical protein